MEKWKTTVRNKRIYQEYLMSCLSAHAETEKTTYKTYQENMKKFLEWMHQEDKNRYLLSEDTIEHGIEIIERYRNYLREIGNSKRTIMNKTTAISTFYDWAVRRRKIKYHPFKDRLEKLRFSDKDKIRNSYFLSTEDILKVRFYMSVEVKKYDLQDRILWELFLDSACRISAIQSLKLSQLHLEKGYFSGVEEKEGYIVNAFFFNECSKLIREWLQYREKHGIISEYVFVTKYKKSWNNMSQGAIRARFKKIGKIIGIEDLYPHTLRKTAINLISNLGGIDVASSYANHRGTQVTSNHYVAKDSPEEVRNDLIKLRKKVGIF
ncbi:Site-specific recombinase, phage integrase family [Fusobacterium necrophorum subsp. funduliforme]|uniref:tyrosine-type recombinase/integrase n=1 Tax=Fusobacterium necrophorum TaxID=859 RepID=UPI00370F2845